MRILQKFFYYSVGFASLSFEKLTNLIQGLIEQDKISEKEGNEILSDYKNKMEEMTRKFDNKLENFVTDKLNSFNYATEEDIKQIETRIKHIEELISKKKM